MQMKLVQVLWDHCTVILAIFIISANHPCCCCANSIHSQSKEIQSAFSFQSIKLPTTQNVIKLATQVTLTLAISSTVTIFPKVATAASIEKGEVLFTQNCASCHRNGENVMNAKRDLKKETLLSYFGLSGSLDEDQIVGWIEKSGQHKRLFFPDVPDGKLSREDYASVISFIVDQAKNDKW